MSNRKPILHQTYRLTYKKAREVRMFLTEDELNSQNATEAPRTNEEKRKCIILMHTGELIQLNMKIMLLLTHPHIIPNLRGCLKRYYSFEYNA